MAERGHRTVCRSQSRRHPNDETYTDEQYMQRIAEQVQKLMVTKEILKDDSLQDTVLSEKTVKRIHEAGNCDLHEIHQRTNKVQCQRCYSYIEAGFQVCPCGGKLEMSDEMFSSIRQKFKQLIADVCMTFQTILVPSRNSWTLRRQCYRSWVAGQCIFTRRVYRVHLPRREREWIGFHNKKWINSRRKKLQERKTSGMLHYCILVQFSREMLAILPNTVTCSRSLWHTICSLHWESGMYENTGLVPPKGSLNSKITTSCTQIEFAMRSTRSSKPWSKIILGTVKLFEKLRWHL